LRDAKALAIPVTVFIIAAVLQASFLDGLEQSPKKRFLWFRPAPEPSLPSSLENLWIPVPARLGGFTGVPICYKCIFLDPPKKEYSSHVEC
jgi:hypothetical protein